jgi:hypothetical protein
MEQGSERRIPVGWIVLGSALILVLLIVTILVTGRKDATNLENGLVQVFAFALSLAIAIPIGIATARGQAKDIVSPHSIKAVRRIVTLGASIQAFRTILEVERERMAQQSSGDGRLDAIEVDATFMVLTSQVDGQLRVVGDAIADWRDVVPDDVDAVIRQGERSEQID